MQLCTEKNSFKKTYIKLEKTNAIVIEVIMTMVEKTRWFDEIENAVANCKGLKDIKRIIEE